MGSCRQSYLAFILDGVSEGTVGAANCAPAFLIPGRGAIAIEPNVTRGRIIYRGVKFNYNCAPSHAAIPHKKIVKSLTIFTPVLILEDEVRCDLPRTTVP